MDFLISSALAEGAPASQGGGFEFLIMIGIFFAIMYFMIIRPQSKRTKEHKALLDSLSKGDEVVTTGGVLGKVTALDENFITLQVSRGVDVQVQRQAVTSVMPKGTIKKHKE
jgi:preprotein translocase subunit YajC